MNNREWLNGLSDEEFVEHLDIIHFESSANPCVLEWSEKKDIIAWLKEPHETTGHEDLVNAGWMLAQESSVAVRYFQNKTSRVLVITRNETEYDTGGSSWKDNDIDLARKCADKIRKEKGWE